MKNAYIVHGGCTEEEFISQPSPSNAHWLPWLQKQLGMKGYLCQTPEMPTPWKPVYSEWKTLFDIFPVDSDTTLIGHSIGGGFFLRWLGENPHPIHRLILVAPQLDATHWKGILGFPLNPALSESAKEIHVFYSDDEPVEGIRESVDLVLRTYPRAKLHRFESMGHFSIEEMHTDAFPELLKVVTG